MVLLIHIRQKSITSLCLPNRPMHAYSIPVVGYISQATVLIDKNHIRNNFKGNLPTQHWPYSLSLT